MAAVLIICKREAFNQNHRFEAFNGLPKISTSSRKEKIHTES
jgi:hypothetical protein